MRYGFSMLLLGVALSTACNPVPDPDPNATEPPGFSPCVPNTRALAQGYSLCPVEEDFPYGDELTGTVIGETEEVLGSSSIGGTPTHRFDLVFSETESGLQWTLEMLGSRSLLDIGGQWFPTDESSELTVRLRVEAPCDDTASHWFEVHDDESGDLLVAGGTTTSAQTSSYDWQIGRTPREDILDSRCVTEPFDCECWESCYALPLRFRGLSTFLELFPTERSRQGSTSLLVFESWRGSGESTCPATPRESARWLVLEGF